jgi:hypothetical protein
MRDRPFEPPADGYLELVNDSDIDAHVARIALEVERLCAPAT